MKGCLCEMTNTTLYKGVCACDSSFAQYRDKCIPCSGPHSYIDTNGICNCTGPALKLGHECVCPAKYKQLQFKNIINSPLRTHHQFGDIRLILVFVFIVD